MTSKALQLCKNPFCHAGQRPHPDLARPCSSCAPGLSHRGALWQAATAGRGMGTHLHDAWARREGLWGKTYTMHLTYKPTAADSPLVTQLQMKPSAACPERPGYCLVFPHILPQPALACLFVIVHHKCALPVLHHCCLTFPFPPQCHPPYLAAPGATCLVHLALACRARGLPCLQHRHNLSSLRGPGGRAGHLAVGQQPPPVSSKV